MPNQPKGRNQYNNVDEEHTVTDDTKNESTIKPKPSTAAKQDKSSSSGWFGGIWSKLAPKPKNQMKLPDDKNPSVHKHKRETNRHAIKCNFCRLYGIQRRSVG